MTAAAQTAVPLEPRPTGKHPQHTAESSPSAPTLDPPHHHRPRRRRLPRTGRRSPATSARARRTPPPDTSPPAPRTGIRAGTERDRVPTTDCSDVRPTDTAHTAESSPSAPTLDLPTTTNAAADGAYPEWPEIPRHLRTTGPPRTPPHPDTAPPSPSPASESGSDRHNPARTPRPDCTITPHLPDGARSDDRARAA